MALFMFCVENRITRFRVRFISFIRKISSYIMLREREKERERGEREREREREREGERESNDV